LKTIIHLKLNLMKNLILALCVIVGFAACKSNDDVSQDRNIQLLPDSSSYASNVFSDTNNLVKADQSPATAAEKPQTKTIIRTIVVEKPAPVPHQVPQQTSQPTEIPPVVASNPVSTPPITGPRSETKRIDSTSSVGVDNSSTTASTAGEKVQKKTGMSKATQGAIIGGVAGAVGGAVISKKKGLGAVVGGIAGAAGGYIIGKKMDKKDNKFLIN
jgi:hypothetical protein